LLRYLVNNSIEKRTVKHMRDKKIILANVL